MQHRAIAAFSLLTIAVSCISCASGYDPYPGRPDMSAEWKWNYAQSYAEADLAASGVQITPYDITYARGRVTDAEKDCSDRGGVWCTYANDDRKALQKMLNVQAGQTNNPSPPAVDSGPIPDLTNVLDSAWKQLEAFPSELTNWVNGLFDALKFSCARAEGSEPFRKM